MNSERPGRLIGCCVALFVAVVWTFWPALQNGYVNYDDPDYLINNLQVQGGLSWANLKWAFSTTTFCNWHPLMWLSLMVDCQLFGPRLWGHHLTSVLLHGVNAVLLFLVLRKGTGSLWRSLVVAACFGVHPLRVESVAWLSERKDVLSGLFCLAALLAYFAYGRRVEARKAGTETLAALGRDAATPGYSLALLFFALSLMSKPMMVTLPFLLLLLDYWPLGRIRRGSGWRLVAEKIPFLVLAAASSVVTVIAQRQGGALEQMTHYSLLFRSEMAVIAYARYLGKFFCPADLAPIYPVVDDWPLWAAAGAVILLLGITTMSLLLRNKAAYLPVGWFWFLGTLVPVIGLVAIGEQSMADRYTYFPLIGFTVALVWGAEALTRRWRQRQPVLGILCAGVLAACALVARQQTRVWKDSVTLFTHAVAATPDNYSAHANLTTALQEQGRFDEALLHAREAARLRPESPETLNNLGASLGMLGRTEEAIPVFQSALKLRPDYAEAHHNLAIALGQRGNLSEAIPHYMEAVRLNPGQAAWFNDFGMALGSAGRMAEAVVQFYQAVQLDPRSASAHNNLGKALLEQGRTEEANIHFQEAARLNHGARLP